MVYNDNDDIYSRPGEYKEYHTSKIIAMRVHAWSFGLGVGFLLGLAAMWYILLH